MQALRLLSRQGGVWSNANEWDGKERKKKKEKTAKATKRRDARVSAVARRVGRVEDGKVPKGWWCGR